MNQINLTIVKESTHLDACIMNTSYYDKNGWFK